MYVTLKVDGKLDNNKVIGVGKFKCALLLDEPKEVFEKKLMEKKTIFIDNYVLKIKKLEKIEYSNDTFSREVPYILPIGVSNKKKTLLQKIKTLYFG